MCPDAAWRAARAELAADSITGVSVFHCGEGFAQFGGRLDWDANAICGDDHNFRGRGNPSTGDHFHAAPNVDHTQDFVREGICEWLNWLRSDIGIDGYRLDFARGFGGAFPPPSDEQR